MSILWILVVLLLIFAVFGGFAINHFLFLILVVVVILVLVGALG